MDTRATLSAALAFTAIICGTILVVTGHENSTLFTMASTFGAYVVGLYSTAKK